MFEKDNMDMKVMILTLLCSISVVLGQNKAAAASRPRCPPSLKCPAVKCLFPIPNSGHCCPICPSGGKKPGTCPVFTGPGHCAEICTGDFDCIGKQKCCSIGCGHDCVNPVTTGKACFYKRKWHAHGASFKDQCNTCICTNGTVSCTMMACMPKPGKCPESKIPGICILACTSDWSCPNVEKCCSIGCGFMCTRPVGEVSSLPNCAGVYCPEIYCDNQYTPPGKCCNVCPSLPSY